MNYGLLTTGFNRKTYEVLVEEMKLRAKSLFGDDVNLNDNSPLGLFIQNEAYFLASGDTLDPGAWELAEKVYNSAYVDTAEGISLDRVCKYIGITRRLAEGSTGQATITGVNGTIVPAGFLLATSGGVQFYTSAQATISGGTATVDIIGYGLPQSDGSILNGIITNVPASTITVIVNPTAGITSVTNAAELTGGRDAETDEELRDRYYLSVSKPGSSSGDSIRAAILEISGVRDALIRINDTTGTVGSIPAKSIAPVILGGDNTVIANKILETKAGGIQSYGTTTVNVSDLSGNTHTIGFTRPTSVDVWVNATITHDSSYPVDGDVQVVTQIIKYIGGTDADETEYDGLAIDDDVILVKCIAAALNVSGITDVVLELSTNGVDYDPSNITITNLQIAHTDSDKVVIS